MGKVNQLYMEKHGMDIADASHIDNLSTIGYIDYELHLGKRLGAVCGCDLLVQRVRGGWTCIRIDTDEGYETTSVFAATTPDLWAEVQNTYKDCKMQVPAYTIHDKRYDQSKLGQE